MTTHSLSHGSFSIERRYDASPARVFAAFADPARKARWFACDGDWVVHEHVQDVRDGGRELWRVGPVGGPEHRNDTVYFDVVPGARLVWSYAMSVGGRRISVSLATVELHPDGDGTRFVLTEHGAYLDGYDGAVDRERGTRIGLDNLEAYLNAGAPAQV